MEFLILVVSSIFHDQFHPQSQTTLEREKVKTKNLMKRVKDAGNEDDNAVVFFGVPNPNANKDADNNDNESDDHKLGKKLQQLQDELADTQKEGQRMRKVYEMFQFTKGRIRQVGTYLSNRCNHWQLVRK